MVQAVMQSACEIYASKANVTVPKVTVNEKVFLPGPPHPGVYGSTWYEQTVLPLLFVIWTHDPQIGER